ncbi:hypothetical protein ACHAWX_007400 [Stephanocyclus meneghinianus]
MSTPRPRPRRHRPPATPPVPIPPNPPSELLQLISSKSWHAVINRCVSHPQEVGSSPCFRNERGYTALHCVMAYNRSVAGEELVPVVNAILRAADEIDWGSEYRLSESQDYVRCEDINTNLVTGVMEDNGPRKTGGSWRLLMDQKNDAQWSPLHLVFVLGGVTFGKAPLARALLQMNSNISENEDVESSYHRYNLLLLGDRQKRTILHHNCETRAPTDDNFEAAHFLLSICPSLMFSKDSRGKNPLAYVLDKLNDASTTTSAILYEEGRSRSYRMLKLLLSGMECEERRKIEERRDEVLMIQKDAMLNQTEAVVMGTYGDRAADDNRGINESSVIGTGFQKRNTKISAEASVANLEVNETKPAEAEKPASNQRVSTKSRVVCGDDTETSAFETNIAITETTQTESGMAASVRGLHFNKNETHFGTTITRTITNENVTPRNILHSACRLSRNVCPSDGSLILFLISPKASIYEYGYDSEIKIADERDQLGNCALHIFLSNCSYVIPVDNKVRGVVKHVPDESASSIGYVECLIVRQLIVSKPLAISTPNNEGNLPLKLAMKSGMRNVVALLVMEYPQAVLCDLSLENIKLFIRLIGCLSLFAPDGANNGEGDLTKRLSAMYFLMKSRPDVVALGGSLSVSSTAGLNKNQLDKPTTPLIKRWLRKWLE